MAEESTTPDRVERWRKAFASVDLEAYLDFFAPDAVFEVVSLGARFESVSEIRGFMDDWFGSYEELEIDVEEMSDLGNGVTFGVFVQQGRPAGSTGYVRYRMAQVATWEDGVIMRVSGYNDVDEARTAAERLAEKRG